MWLGQLSILPQECIMETLRVGERFPQLQARAVDGTTLRLPDELHGTTAVLLFYRGHW
jgi:peroxiredoxin